MRVPQTLSEAFGKDFEAHMAQFAVQQGMIPAEDEIRARRFLTRSVLPHLEKLSQLFNRIDDDGKAASTAAVAEGLKKYWHSGSNPENLRMAYWMYFMPCNLFRVASVWAELGRLGFRWQASDTFRGIEFGAGPAAGACGILAGEAYHPTPVGLPKEGNWALIEQDRATLKLGQAWAESYWGFADPGRQWEVRPFHRTIDATNEPLLPRKAPQFNLWLSSYFLNELNLEPAALADRLMENWTAHLEEGGVAILVEPALRMESRKLLALRRELVVRFNARVDGDFQILLPCLGHQACGALADAEDWCHEEVTWWRPPYLRTLDELTGLDKRNLPFSYLVVVRSRKSRTELLPALAGSPSEKTYRLVSPSRHEGRDLEFFVCGQDGKKRGRMREDTSTDEADIPGRGDILKNTTVRGDPNCARIERKS